MPQYMALKLKAYIGVEDIAARRVASVLIAVSPLPVTFGLLQFTFSGSPQVPVYHPSRKGRMNSWCWVGYASSAQDEIRIQAADS